MPIAEFTYTLKGELVIPARSDRDADMKVQEIVEEINNVQDEATFEWTRERATELRKTV